jgi:hypothetical protein
MKTIKPILVIALGFALTASVCQARLGETKDQCIARYGQAAAAETPTGGQIGDEKVYFRVKDTYIVVIFVNGVSAWEDFSVGLAQLPDDQIATILESESGGMHWKKDDNVKTPDVGWTREDGAIALKTTEPPYATPEFIIESQAYAAAQTKADKDRAAAEKQKGF